MIKLERYQQDMLTEIQHLWDEPDAYIEYVPELMVFLVKLTHCRDGKFDAVGIGDTIDQALIIAFVSFPKETS